MASIRDDATVAFRKGERFTESLEPLNLSAAPERRRLEPRAVCLITGRLGGVGLVIAEHLAREYNARLILVGRSALPPEAEWEAALNDAHQSNANKQRIRKLLEIRSKAAGLLIAQGDVTNLDRMREIVDLARQHYGKIDGVFHAAGVLEDGPLMLKTAENAARVIDPKVRGTLVLEEALRDTPPGCFVLFSSISSLFPPAGQVDYAAANAFLDSFALSRKDPVIVINWGAWREVGMAVRSASPHPLLDERLLATPREVVYSSRFSQQKQWLLSEHRLKAGKALVPGTGYLEMAAAAYARGSTPGPIELQDVFFLAPLSLDTSESRDVRVQLTREKEGGAEKGGFRFSVFARQDEWVEHSTGQIQPCLERPAAQIDQAAIAARCLHGEVIFDDQHRTKQENYFDFGPRWHCLKRLQIGKHEGLAELALDDAVSADSSAYLIHPALLDLATGCSLYLTDGYGTSDDLYLPFSYRRLRSYRPLPVRIFSHIRPRRENVLHGEVVTFDITLFDEQGQVLVEIEGFTMRRIADPAKVPQLNTAARGGVLPGANQPIDSFSLSGISPLEGVRALTRILQTRTPLAVVAVSQSLEDLGDKAAQPQAFDAAAPGAAPAGEGVEETLAGWWQDLLGVEQVELDDDFFALGGHSLVGLRLLAKIKKTYQEDMELAVLFEARTVRQLADVIGKSKQPSAEEPKTWSTLVPIQPNGSRIPFFCVHGVGGGVLNYEAMAKALGPDQPFYAFRSLHLAGGEIREASVEELASAYIKEMRAFLPYGPYAIGGGSFGGIVAVEMAQQLYAQGAEPASLVLFDTSAPGSVHQVDSAEKLRGFWQRLRNQGLAYLLRKIALKGDDWRQRLVKRGKDVALVVYRWTPWDLPVGLRYYQVQKAHFRALTRYKVKRYPGKITLMRAVGRGYLGMELLGAREDEALGWGSFAGGGLEIRDVPGEHGNVLNEPYIQTVVQELKTVLPKPETIAPSQQPVA
jgi:thioesterase domain-containing protein/NADP-dependent 3-hydroxy acid dehydrogenase YdfG/acyl carrier protein